MSKQVEDILRKCAGVEIKRKASTNWKNDEIITEQFLKVGDIVLPDEDIFIKILYTATKGTIAKVAGIEIDTYEEAYNHTSANYAPNTLMAYTSTIIYAVEGRKQTGRISAGNINVMRGQGHETKYVRNVKKHKKVKIKNPVNKYKQELQKGDWVVGVKHGHQLAIGRITRWTNSNVWGTLNEDLTDKSKEFKFDSIQQTFTMPNDDHVQLLTMAVLQGSAL